MHVLVTVNAAWNIWNFRKPLVEALLADGHRVSVLAPPDESVADLEALGCHFRPLAMNVKGLNPFEDLRLQSRLGREFRAARPDIVLSYTIKNNIFGAGAARMAGVPFVPNVTGLGTAFLSGRALESVIQQLYRRAFAPLPRVFFQNEDDRDLFLERRIVRAEQARLLRDKGLLEFVEAARIVRARHPRARFQLLGALGPQNRTAINAAMVEAWVSEGVVEYLGTTDDVRPFIAAATCVVLPSYREGAPRTLIEAAAMGRPVIASDVPGCRAVVERDVSGLFCEARSGESLAEAMERFLALPHEARAAMGAAGRAKMAREFDQALVIDAYRETIATLAKRRSA
jgi:hypothetical protein